MNTTPNPSSRAVAIVKAQCGRVRELRRFVAELLPEIRGAAGLRKLEVSRSLSAPSQWMLPEHLVSVGELFSE